MKSDTNTAYTMDPNDDQTAKMALFNMLQGNINTINKNHEKNGKRDKDDTKTTLGVTDVTESTCIVKDSCKFAKGDIYSSLTYGLTFGLYSLTVINEDENVDYKFELKKKQSELGDDIQDPGES